MFGIKSINSLNQLHFLNVAIKFHYLIVSHLIFLPDSAAPGYSGQHVKGNKQEQGQPWLFFYRRDYPKHSVMAPGLPHFQAADNGIQRVG